MPTDGIASATSALRYWERRQDVVANNLANANTDGFKAERVFARLLDGNLPVPDAATDLREGSFRPTGNPLDVSLRGDQFFVVRTPNGDRWSRGGSWQVDAEGFLADADGNRALGAQGAIRVTRDAQGRPLDVAHLAMDKGGQVSVDGVALDRLRVERAPDAVSLQHDEGTRFLPAANAQPVDAAQRDVRQGFLEDSNVNSVSTLVDLITIQRNFAFAQKVLTTLDGIRGTIANDIAKPA